MNQVNAEIDALQLFEERVYALKQVFSLGGIGDDGVNHLVVAFHDGIEFLPIAFVTFESHLRGGYQLVCNTSKGTYYYYDRLRPSLCLHDFFQA